MKKNHQLAGLDIVLNFSAIYHCAPNWRLGPDWAQGLTDYDLWCVWGGLGRMVTSDGPIDLYPGLCVWMRPGRRYEATHEVKAPLRVTAVHFNLRNKTRLLKPSEFTPPVEVFEPGTPGYFESALGHIIDLRAQGKLPGVAAHLFKLLLLEIMAEGSRKAPDNALDRHHQQVLAPVLAAIHAQPERRFTVKELAARAGYSVDHFVRLFRVRTGLSPKEFMVRRRLDRATALLKGSSHTVTQIADLLGYQDLGFFSRQFKTYLGTSPDHFRRVGPGMVRVRQPRRREV